MSESQTPNPSDTMVLRIIEKDNSKQGEDHDVFILYDTYNEVYLVRGKRSDTHRTRAIPYSFEANTRYSVYAFLSTIIPKEHDCVFEMYNYRNLPTDSNDITYYLLRENCSLQNEIVAYTDEHIRYKGIMNMLFLLKSISNEYTP